MDRRCGARASPEAHLLRDSTDRCARARHRRLERGNQSRVPATEKPAGHRRSRPRARDRGDLQPWPGIQGLGPDRRSLFPYLWLVWSPARSCAVPSLLVEAARIRGCREHRGILHCDPARETRAVRTSRGRTALGADTLFICVSLLRESARRLPEQVCAGSRRATDRQPCEGCKAARRRRLHRSTGTR